MRLSLYRGVKVMADKISDTLIDEILASAKQYSTGETVDIYSGDRLDRLLADIAADAESVTAEPENTFENAVDKPVAESLFDSVGEGSPGNAEKEETLIEDDDSDDDIVREIQQAVKEGLFDNEPSTDSELKSAVGMKVKKQKSVRKITINLNDIKARDAEVSADMTAESADNTPLTDDTESGLTESPLDDNASEVVELSSEGESDGAELSLDREVDLQVSDDGQLSLSADEIDIVDEDISEETEEEPHEEVKSVSGQISIEKTRMFNEVKIRGEYNPNISHNLGNKVARTAADDFSPVSSPVMGEEKYRKHFMNRPVQNLMKTQERRKLTESLPEKTIETYGVVVKKSGAVTENTDGIQPLPTIVPAEYELEQDKTRIDLPKINRDDIAENQIVLEGFADDEEIAEQSEEQAEAELRVARQEAVNEFVNKGLIFKQELDEPKSKFERRKVNVAREYYGPKDKPAVEKILSNEKKSLTAKTVVLSVLCFIMSALAIVAGADNGNFELYGNNELIYVAVQVTLLLIACAVSYDSFSGFVRCIKERKMDMSVPVVLSTAAALCQCVTAFFFADHVESSACVMAGAAIIPMIFKAVGELLRCKNDIDNFYFVSDDEKELYTVENIDDEDTANEIARGLMLGAPDIKFSRLTDFPARFVELSRSADVTGLALKLIVPAVSLAAVAVGAVYGAVSKNIFGGISAFAGTVLMGMPAAAGIVSAANLRSVNNKLRGNGAVINGYDAVENAVNSNGVIIDSCDAFFSGGCNIEGIKLYHKMRIDEAILYTASVIIASGGVLSDIFDGVIIGKQELLFPVETLAYEEKLGCSCWIHNHRVLVGNRELLLHHNVEVPDKDLEDKYRTGERNVIYLAIEGKIAAMFVVVYKSDEQTAKCLRQLERDGLTVFFRTSDANITESFVEEEFGLPENVVKIINPVAGEMFLKIKNEVPERSDAQIVHDGSVKSMLMALHGAHVINSMVTVSRTIQIVISLLGIVIVALLAFMSGLTQIGVLQIIIYQTVWMLVLALMPKMRKI